MGEQQTAPASLAERDPSTRANSAPQPRSGIDSSGTPTTPAHRLDTDAICRLLVEHGRDLMALHAPDGRFRYVSPAIQALLGYQVEDLLDAEPADYAHPADLEGLWGRWQDSMLAGEGRGCLRHRFRRKDGAWIWLETWAVPLHEDPRDPARVTSVMTASREVTAAIAAEQALATSEERLRLALHTAGMGILDIRRPSRAGHYSDEYLQIYGYGPEHREQFAAGWEPLVHPDDARALTVLREYQWKGDQDYIEATARRMHRSGRWIWVRARGRAFEPDVQGHPTRWLSTLQDVDQQHRDEQALQEGRARLELAQSIARLGDWRVDMPSLRHRWSDEAFRLLGYTPGECEPSLQAFLARVHPEDLHRMTAIARRIETEWHASDADARVVLPDGTVRQVHLQIRLARDAAGSPLSMTGTVQDVTERRQAEAALRDGAAELAQAQRIARVGSWVWHRQADRTTRSPEFCRILGLDPAAPEMPFAAHARFATATTWRRLEDAVTTALERGTPYEVEVEIVRPDGSTGWAMVRGEAARGRDGVVLRLFGTLQDITDSKRAEIELREARDQVRELSSHREDELDQERKRIALDVHDEVGQMLTAMKLQLDLLHSQLGNERAVAAAAERLRGLVEDTIEVTRNVALNLRPAALDLGLVPALEWLAEDFTLRSEIPCRLQAATGEVALGEKAATELFRIAQESLTNVARHARASCVSVSLQRIDGALRMSIRDDGCGFDTGRARALGHFGLLGMRERALRLDARLLIDSHPGAGTTISVQLPAAASPGAAP